MIVNSSKYKSTDVYDLYEVCIQCFSALYMIQNLNIGKYFSTNSVMPRLMCWAYNHLF
jgi:hypothetical protein